MRALLALALLLLASRVHCQSDHYVAAIVEHAPISVPGLVTQSEAVAVKMQNLDVYEQHLKNASAAGAQIIVFPEDGLFGDDKCTRDEILPYLERVPNNRLPQQRLFNPCNEQNSAMFKDTPALVRLSCLALSYNTVVVADVGDVQQCSLSNDPFCPRDGRYQYNTLVALDSDGTLLAKYHKTHLFYEPQYNTPRHPVPVTFTASFGVRFGMVVCFDLMYPLPPVDLVLEEGVTDIVYSTWWINTPPSFSATQYQQAWSRTLGANLLAAGNGNAWLYSGSGIFSRGRVLAEVYNIYYTPHDALRVAKVPILSRASAAKEPSNGVAVRVGGRSGGESTPLDAPLVTEPRDWWAQHHSVGATGGAQFQIHCPMPEAATVAADELHDRPQHANANALPFAVSWPLALEEARELGTFKPNADGSVSADSHTHGVLTLSAPFQMHAGREVSASATALHLTCWAQLNASSTQPYIKNDTQSEWYVVFAFAGQYDNETAFYREHFCAAFRCFNQSTCLYDLIFANTIFSGFELTANMPLGHMVFALTSTNNAALIPDDLIATGVQRSGPSSALHYVRSDRDGGASPFGYILLNAALLARDMRNR